MAPLPAVPPVSLMPLVGTSPQLGPHSPILKLFGGLFDGGPQQSLRDPTTPDQLKQINSAVQSAQNQLETGFLNPVTDGEARSALKSLTSLPKDLQGQAIEKLDPGSFGRLLSELPASEREQFKPLMLATSDPERKLRLFAEYHKAKVSNDAASDHKKTSDEGSIFGQSHDQAVNERTNKQRDFIAEHTLEEVDSELSFLLQKSKEGKLSPDAVEKYIAAKEKEHDTERATNTNQYSTLDGLPDGERAEFVQKSAEKKLASGVFNPVTDGEATDALRNISALPQALRGRVMEGMDKDAFVRLLDNVPDKKPEDWKALYESTHDPERKLLLWAEYHKAQAQGDVTRLGESGSDDATQRRNKLRGNAASETQSEVDDEVAHLKKLIKEGKATEKDILALDERKQLEHRLEMEFNVNLTSERGSGGFLGFGKRERRVWTLDELKQIQSSFQRLPKDMVANNGALEEIHREADDNGDKGTGGYHSGKLIKMFDSGSGTLSQPQSTGWRFDGEQSKLGGHEAGHEVTPFEAVMVHEIGHAVHDENGPAGKLLERFMQNAGWSRYSTGELKDAMRAGLLAEGKKPEEIDAMIDANVKKLKDNRKENYSVRPTVTVNGKVYEVDPYSGKFLSYDEGKISGGSRWGYARSNPLDHFAEHYSMAVHNPEQLHEDLVKKPKEEVDTREAERDVKKRALEKMESEGKASAAELKALRDDVASTEKRLAEARSSRDSLEKEWSLMRNDVFHTDTTTQQESAELKKALAGLPADKQDAAQKIEAQFETESARCATPEQVMRLRQTLQVELANL